ELRAPGELVGEAVAERAGIAEHILPPSGKEKPARAEINAGSDDLVEGAGPEREIVPVNRAPRRARRLYLGELLADPIRIARRKFQSAEQGPNQRGIGL